MHLSIDSAWVSRSFARAVARLAVIGALCVSSTSCKTSPWYEYAFMPAPLELEVRAEAEPGSQVRALVTVIGIARARDTVPPHAVVRMRLENLGTTTAQLDDTSLQLVSADLQTFGKAVLGARPSHPPEPIAPGAEASYDMSFPLPEGKAPTSMNLQGLNLRWTIVFNEQRITTGATFQRLERPVYVDDDPRVNVGFGFGYYHGN